VFNQRSITSPCHFNSMLFGRIIFDRVLASSQQSPWCAVEHRVIDWASRSSSGEEEFEVVIMIAVADRRDAWVPTEFLT
jgi:hypothetical protein